MDGAIKAWNDTDLGSFQLTSLGIVITHANWKGTGTGDALPLDAFLPGDDEP